MIPYWLINKETNLTLICLFKVKEGKQSIDSPMVHMNVNKNCMTELFLLDGTCPDFHVHNTN